MCGPKAAGGSISYINFPLVPQISLKLSVRKTTLSQLWSPDQSLLWPPSSLLLPRVPSHTNSLESHTPSEGGGGSEGSRQET